MAQVVEEEEEEVMVRVEKKAMIMEEEEKRGWMMKRETVRQSSVSSFLLLTSQLTFCQATLTFNNNKRNCGSDFVTIVGAILQGESLQGSAPRSVPLLLLWSPPKTSFQTSLCLALPLMHTHTKPLSQQNKGVYFLL